jgi:hypothetical protein
MRRWRAARRRSAEGARAFRGGQRATITPGLISADFKAESKIASGADMFCNANLLLTASELSFVSC